MSRFGINCNDMWREVSEDEFTNIAPSSEYDRNSVQGLMELIREALEVLRNPEQLTEVQIKDLKARM